MLSFPPAQPQNAPANPSEGDTFVEGYQNGIAFFTRGASDWALSIFHSNDDRKFTHRDETGADYVQGSLAGPQNPPANPDNQDVHLEVYDNALVFFNYSAGGAGAGWDGNNVTFVPLASGQGVSDDAGNTLTLGTDGLPFLAEPAPVSYTHLTLPTIYSV